MDVVVAVVAVVVVVVVRLVVLVVVVEGTVGLVTFCVVRLVVVNGIGFIVVVAPFLSGFFVFLSSSFPPWKFVDAYPEEMMMGSTTGRADVAGAGVVVG